MLPARQVSLLLVSFPMSSSVEANRKIIFLVDFTVYFLPRKNRISRQQLIT